MVIDNDTEEIKDRTNSHIILLAKNKKGFREINKIISNANISGYYYKPRISLEDLLSLNPNNVIVTTACIASFIGKYPEDALSIFGKVKEHFGNSLFLEVQYHNTKKQIEYNKVLLNFHKKFNVPLIMGTDSHVIYPEQEKDRVALLYSKGIVYDDEDNWNLDYPDTETAFSRFQTQGVLSDSQILEAINNTNICLTFEDYSLDRYNIKLPTIYPNKTQSEKDEIYKNIIYENWNNYKNTIPLSFHRKYEEEIKKEMKVVTETKMTDYFLLNEKIIKKGIELGGKLSKTGRGSAVSFFTNKMLGFTDVDRISAKTTMFPSR